jgi:guanine nucleotide-binding protein G(I)/G(S)/G(T) subunit beta-1
LSEVVKSKHTTLAPIRGPPATKVRRTLKGHFGRVTALHWGGDSRTLVSASQDGNLLVWNAVTSNKLQSISLKSSYVMAVGIEQSKGNLVACGGLDNLCTVYKRNDPASATEMASHDGFLSCCRFLSEQQLLTSSGDSRCILWDVEHAKPLSTFAEHKADAMFLAIKPGDKNVFVSCSVDQTSKVWDIRAPQHSVQTFRGHTGDINSVEFMPSDTNCFATCGQDQTVRLFDMRAYNEVAKYGSGKAVETETDGLTSCAFSKSGRLVFCGTSDGNLLAFDVLSEKNTPAFTVATAHEKQVSCVGVSPHGEALCTGSWDTFVKIWA